MKFSGWFRKTTLAATCGALVVSLSGTATAWDDDQFRYPRKRIKNVIVMVPDGCDETVQTVARWYKGEALQVDKMKLGAVKIHMANSVITGSAAAATAFATGHKTTVRFLGVGPRTEDLLTGFEPTADPYAPVASILEAAQRRGKATGLVATSRISHATPAAFGSHIQDRGWDNDIMEHLVYNNIDVVLGGGARHLIPKGDTYTTSFGAAWGGKRTDGENLMDVLIDRGYMFIDNKEDMDAVTSGRVWGLFDDSHMQPDMDRQHFAPHEPSIAEMTAKAIELLSQDRNGFFLMVEGSQVDWAGHNNDPVYMVKDFIAFDDAVKVACDFAKDDGQTLVLAYPDHNTGGMKIGHYATAVGYTETTIEDLVDPLLNMSITSGGLVKMMENMPIAPSLENFSGETADEDYEAALETYTAELSYYLIGNQTVMDYWNIDLNETDAREIAELEPSVGLSYALARVVSKNHTVIGWTTHGHNGETVPLWMYGGQAPVGTIDNTDLAAMAADAMRVDLDKTTDRLYVDLSTVTDAYKIDETDPENPVLIIKGAQLPISKDYMIFRGKTIQLPGITVLAPETGKVYASKKALRFLRLL